MGLYSKKPRSMSEQKYSSSAHLRNWIRGAYWFVQQVVLAEEIAPVGQARLVSPARVLYFGDEDFESLRGQASSLERHVDERLADGRAVLLAPLRLAGEPRLPGERKATVSSACGLAARPSRLRWRVW